jgi:hypothetical protein
MVIYQIFNEIKGKIEVVIPFISNKKSLPSFISLPSQCYSQEGALRDRPTPTQPRTPNQLC